MHRFLVVLLALAFAACASMPPGTQLHFPTRVPVPGTSYSVSVRVLTGFDDRGSQGWCGLPDAANEISCEFHLSSLDANPATPDGYRYLSPSVARVLCADALWSAGPAFRGAAGACAEALMETRWMEHSDVYEPGPGEPR